MSDLRYLDIERAGSRVRVHVRAIDKYVSPHSGRDLLRIVGAVRNNDPEFQDWLLDATKQKHWESSLSSLGIPAAWTVGLEQWTSSGRDYSYILALQEHEVLEIERLIIEDLNLKPYRYKEEARQDGLQANVKVELSTEENEKFLNVLRKGGYFPVQRRGIQDEPREMRFGAVYWSSSDDKIKYDFLLIERTPEDEAPRHPWDLPGSNARAHLAYEIALRKRLFLLLEEKGIINGSEIQEIENLADDDAWRIDHKFWRVDDVDELP